ncbi:hypothetical protein ACG6P0_002457 [Enterococcus hirae]|uniref:hypothetical protein n=1 Tax=Enterococcus TaxID=1350 RepID=UPI000559800D|nr:MULTISPECIES: hypothetical protein [Enterococcus]KNB93409.1 hypothetical protein LK32_11505 [Enterococcus hirae]OTO54641.1 hypothetical protein A5813_000062 [Enterococcus faecium]OTO62259.1 hypothetical protein A5812_001174 [Enterococcus faecium]
MIKKLIQFSMDLYDIDSGTIVFVESDHLVIKFADERQIIIWVVDDMLYPEIVHGFEESKAVEFETVKKVMELIEKYEEGSDE